MIALRVCSVLLYFLAGFSAWNPFGEPAQAADYEPDVQIMVDKGIDYLEKHYQAKSHYAFVGIASAGFGEHALMAYAHMKVHHDPDSAVVRQGVKAARTYVGMLGQRDPGGTESKSVYTASICGILLAEVDRVKYRDELNRVAGYLKKVQYSNGPYGYFGMHEGDTSQTQYAMLALWTLDHAGVIIDYSIPPQTISWLLRVQDPTGGFPYQGKDPGNAGKRVPQTEVTASMGVAGGSAMLIGGDIVRTWGEKKAGNDADIPGLPKSVKLNVEGIENLGANRPKVPKEPILESMKELDGWLSKNSANPGKLTSVFPYYQLYTLERYESFKEVALGKAPDHSPPWFRDGVGWLKERQASDGGWTKEAYNTMSGTTSTSFALLYLIRSTQKAIEQTQEGMLAGGQGLPGDTTKIRVNGTQIEGEPVAEAVNDLLNLLEGDDPNALEGKSLPEDMKLPTDPKERRAQVDRLIRLVRGSSSWQARRVAARLLGQSDEIRVVPALIYALDDPDTKVRTFARDGLRFISRKFEGFGMQIKPGNKQDYGELRRVQRLWREWYLTMEPGYIFVTE